MKKLLILLLLILESHAQVITTYDSRTNQPPFLSHHLAVDIGDINEERNPDYRDYSSRFDLRSVATPALIDVATGLGVTITGNLRQAHRDLDDLDAARRPARRELESFLAGKTPKEFRTDIRRAFRNLYTNTAFTATQRGLLSNALWAIEADGNFSDLRDAKRAEDAEIDAAGGAR